MLSILSRLERFKKCYAAFILSLVFSMADNCNPEKSLLLKLACPPFPHPLDLPLVPSRQTPLLGKNKLLIPQLRPSPAPSPCHLLYSTYVKILELPTKTYVGLLQNSPFFLIVCIPQMQALKQLSFT